MTMGMKAKGLFEMELEVQEVEMPDAPAPQFVVMMYWYVNGSSGSVTPFRDTEAEAEKDLADYIAEHAFKEVQGG
jgi:hypothetical protein